MPEMPNSEFWKTLKPIENSQKPDALPEVYLSQVATDDDRYYVPFTETVAVADLIGQAAGGEGVDVAFEVVGSEETLRTCLPARDAERGRVMLVGLAGTVSIDAFAMVNKEQSIITSVGYRDVYPDLIRLVEQGMDLTAIGTTTIALADVVRDGFEALLRGGDQIKILVRPSGGNAPHDHCG
jgi:(R,R)-butanediol dehydrogenase/meso-butanediol dehydrogenase/diacetyl reductase